MAQENNNATNDLTFSPNQFENIFDTEELKFSLLEFHNKRTRVKFNLKNNLSNSHFLNTVPNSLDFRKSKSAKPSRHRNIGSIGVETFEYDFPINVIKENNQQFNLYETLLKLKGKIMLKKEILKKRNEVKTNIIKSRDKLMELEMLGNSIKSKINSQLQRNTNMIAKNNKIALKICNVINSAKKKSNESQEIIFKLNAYYEILTKNLEESKSIYFSNIQCKSILPFHLAPKLKKQKHHRNSCNDIKTLKQGINYQNNLIQEKKYVSNKIKRNLVNIIQSSNFEGNSNVNLINNVIKQLSNYHK